MQVSSHNLMVTITISHRGENKASQVPAISQVIAQVKQVSVKSYKNLSYKKLVIIIGFWHSERLI